MLKLEGMKMRYIYIPYALLLVSFSIAVYSIVNSNELDVDVKDNDAPKEKVEKVKPVNMTLIVSTDSYKQQYTQRMFNVDTVEDFLNVLRNEKGLKYEKNAFIYGTQLDNINGIRAPEGFQWVLFSKGEDITYRIGQTSLIAGDDDFKTLELRLIQR